MPRLLRRLLIGASIAAALFVVALSALIWLLSAANERPGSRIGQTQIATAEESTGLTFPSSTTFEYWRAYHGLDFALELRITVRRDEIDELLSQLASPEVDWFTEHTEVEWRVPGRHSLQSWGVSQDLTSIQRYRAAEFRGPSAGSCLRIVIDEDSGDPVAISLVYFEI